MKQKEPQTARFIVVATRYEPSFGDGLVDPMPRSSVSPFLPDVEQFSQVLLRFETPRENYHPDDNDLRLSCSLELHAALQKGMRGVGTWQGHTLLSFTPDDLKTE